MEPRPDTPASPAEVEALLAGVRAGDAVALDRLFTLTYAELHRAAAALLRSEAPARGQAGGWGGPGPDQPGAGRDRGGCRGAHRPRRCPRAPRGAEPPPPRA